MSLLSFDFRMIGSQTTLSALHHFDGKVLWKSGCAHISYHIQQSVRDA